MKILHIVTGFEVGFPGGITNYVRVLASTQASAGETVYVLDDRPDRDWRTSHDGGYFVRGAELTHYPRFGVSTRVDSGQVAEFESICREVEPDLIHVHMAMGLDELLLQEFGNFGAPYVVSLHDYYMCCPRFTLIDYAGRPCSGPGVAKCERCIGRLDQVDLLHRASLKLQRPLPRWPSDNVTRRNSAMRQFLGTAHRVLAVSNRVAEIYQAFAPAADIEVLHIGNETAGLPAAPKSLSGPLRLSFIGTLTKYKGADLLFRLAGAVDPSVATFHFFGRVQGDAERRALAQSSVEDHGPYVPADLAAIAAQTDVGLVLPIWEDNAPQVVMEFINLGIPVIATRRGGIPDFVHPDSGYLFEPDESGVERAAELIRRLTRQHIRSWAERLPVLKSPIDHQAELERVYANAIRSFGQ